MTLAPGTRLGPYEIVSRLGAGGMGEVWRARDSRLNREVAIKTSREQFNERFEREARAVAALNHPNICHLYDVGPNYLVMELVEGETLWGPVALEQALKIADQIAQALEAAHEKGIIHRDLKPSNIKITANGVVKVLDFGLARILVPESVDLTQTPTVTSMPTQAGAILGTAPYMAPEQARGKVVDKRADIWAFGLVLHEILTGQQMFAGETVTDTLAGVLTKDPDLSIVPWKVRRLLRCCLEKDPGKRLRDIGDWASLLDETEPPVATMSTRKPLWAVAALAALVGAMGAASWFLATGPVLPEARVDIVTPPTSDPSSFALSPDGRKVAYAASGEGGARLFVRSLDFASAQAVAGTEGAGAPFWSPDSRSLGFWADGKIKRVDLGGGTPQVIADSSFRYGADWNAGGVILFGSDNSSGISRVAVSGGQPVAVTKLNHGNASHRWPRFLPDGKHFLFYALGGESGIYLGSLDGTGPRRLTAADTAGEYVPSGWLVWVQQNALVARRFDAANGRLSGDPVTLAQPVFASAGTVAGAFAVSRSGLIAWRGGTGGRRQLVWFSRTGERLGALGEADDSMFSSPEVSPDGRRVAVTRGPVGTGDIWLVDSARASRFTFNPAEERGSIWSPDGSRVLFASNRNGATDLYLKQADGSGSEQPALVSPESKRPNSWSPDGRFILYHSDQNAGDLMVLPLGAGQKPYPFLSTKFNEQQGAFSPDGKWVAYQSNETGRDEIYVRPFPGPGGVWQISSDGGLSPRWRADAKELYYLGPGSKLMAVGVAVQGGSITPGQPVPLFATKIVSAPIRPQYDVSRDGRFVVVEAADVTAAPLTLLQNWKPPK